MSAVLSIWKQRQIRRQVQSGALLAYPTEGVYGLGCDPWNAEAVRRLLALKRRPMSKGLIVLAADVAQLQGLVQMPDGLAAEAIRSSWPGPVTWVMPADSAAPDWITGGQSTMAVRVTAHPLAAAICRAAGQALISTSANRAGRPPAKTAVQVRRLTQGVPVGIWPGQLGGLRGPTPIFDAATGRQLR